MGEDERLAQLGERVAALEATVSHVHADLSSTRKDLIEVASASGRAAAISYNEGLRASFITDTKDRLRALRRLEIVVAVLAASVMAMATIVGVKLQVLVP